MALLSEGEFVVIRHEGEELMKNVVVDTVFLLVQSLACILFLFMVMMMKMITL